MQAPCKGRHAQPKEEGLLQPYQPQAAEAIHPESLELAQPEDRNVFEAEVDLVQFNGVTTITRFRAGDAFLQGSFFSRSPAAALQRGMTAQLSVDGQRILLLEAQD